MRLIAAALLLGFALNASAQCTKDTDCRFDRICEQGRCMSPPTKKDEAGKTTTNPALAPMSSADFAEVVLVCVRSPEPGAVLSRLKSDGFIDVPREPIADGVPEFVVKRPLNLFGFRAREVSGWQDVVPPSPFFMRGPGTAPPTFLSVVVEGDADRVGAAVIARLRERLQQSQGLTDAQRRAIEARAAVSVRKRGPLAEVYCGHDFKKHGPLPEPR